MSPDRRISWPFGKEEPDNAQFHVTTQGADLVFDWLNLKHSTAGNELYNRVPGVNGDKALVLANTSTAERDTVNNIATFVSYDEDELEFELNSYIVFGDQRERINALFSDPEEESRKLRETRRQIEAALERSEEETGIKVKPRDADDILVQKGETEFVLHPVTDLGTKAFCMHIKKDMDTVTPESFAEIYKIHGEVLEQLVKAFYQSHNESEPDITHEVKPPKTLANKLGVAQSALKQRKKMLAASGMIDGDEEIALEVQAKVPLIEMPSETFEDVGGNERAKEELKTIVHALREPEAYRRWGTSAPKGILLFGEPGTGKTMLTKALAHEAGVGIYVVELADILHSLYGKTERLLNEVFKQARAKSPVVILIDELDSLAGSRKESSEITSRVVSVLLTNLDGVRESSDGIVVVGTTNRVEAIDPALKRPGRLDLLVEVPMPDKDQRVQIFNLKMSKAQEIAFEAGGNQLFDHTVDVPALAEVANAFTGADVEEVIRRALAKKVRLEEKGLVPGFVTTEDILAVISGYETVRKARRVGFSNS